MITISITVCLYNLEFNEKSGQRAWRKPHKDSAYRFQQILEAGTGKQQPDSHLPPITQTIQIRGAK